MGMEGRHIDRRTAIIAGSVAAVLVVVVSAILYFTVFTISVTVQGRPMRVATGTTAGDLVKDGAVNARRGAVIAVKTRAVLKAGAGGPVIVVVDGKPVSPATVLRNGDVVSARNGANSVEPLKVRKAALAPSARFIGSGPVQTTVASGTPGLESVQYGSISGQIASRKVIKAPVMRLVVRTHPSTGKKLIALTFDDGPWPGQTEAILKILQANKVPATFFEIGRQARGRPALSRMLVQAGMLVGNHSESHPEHMNRLSAAQVAAQITQAENDITAASGQRPVYFRPPGGNVSPAMYGVLNSLGMQWVQWDVDTDDWKRPSAETIVNRVLAGARDGAVVLMHDGGGDRSHTIEALPIIIRALKAEGYTLVRLDGLRSLPHRMG